MEPNFDVIVVGSGPAGISVAFPLVRAGLKVLMVDGGNTSAIAPPTKPFLEARQQDSAQWKWMLGQNFHALQKSRAISPKFRAPTLDYVFEDFNAANRIKADNFVAVGSLSVGGLSNAWGCGVAKLSAKELEQFPFPASDIEKSYEEVTRRIGVSGSHADDLSDYFGLDEWSSSPIAMDILHDFLFSNYLSRREELIAHGFRLGRSRVAALSQDLGSRKACDLSGNCLWGCHRRALYSSKDELSSLMQHRNFSYQSGFIVEQILHTGGHISIQGKNKLNNTTIAAKRIILAAGTLATTRLSLQALKFNNPIKMQSCPTAAFLLWLPRMLGAARGNSFGLGQLSFTLNLTDEISAFGSTFSTTGIPVTEFIRHIPLRKRYAIDLLRNLLSSCVVGNMFLPGNLATTTVSLNIERELVINGGYSERTHDLMKQAASLLRKSYWRLGALLLPMSFTIGQPGGDIHYSSTLPMRLNPITGETNAEGELIGFEGLHVVDGACLTTLPEKSHTLTIMANADRIGRALAVKIRRLN